MRTKLAAAALGASLLAGGGVGAWLMTPTIATAADSSSSSSSSSSTAQQPDQWVQDALSKLVDKGTITKAQATAVAQALEAARPAGGPGGPGGRGGGPGLDVAAKALGIDAATLRTDLESGKTIAAVAKERNVDVQTVIAALVADMNSHLADAVSSGRLTQAQADDMKSHATERATALVNGERPTGAPDGGPGGPPPDGAGAPGSSSSGSSSSATSGASTA